MINCRENKIITLCAEYAAIAHMGQTRKDLITPYIVHPGRVASLVSRWSDYYVYIASAWLHDVVEDCSLVIDGEIIVNNHSKHKNIKQFLTESEIFFHNNRNMGEYIWETVQALTMSQDKTLPKKIRKEMYYKQLLEAGYGAILIKCCDRIDNLATVNHFSQGGFKWYIKDTEMLMSYIREDLKKSYLEAYGLLEEMLDNSKKEYIELYGELHD